MALALALALVLVVVAAAPANGRPLRPVPGRLALGPREAAHLVAEHGVAQQLRGVREGGGFKTFVIEVDGAEETNGGR